MTSDPVVTFETRNGEAALFGEDASLPAASARLPRGAYTTLRTYGGRGIVRFGAHLGRLEESVALQGRPGRIDEEVSRRLVVSALREARHPESRLRLTFAPPRLFVSVAPFAPPARSRYEQGVACVTLPLHRDRPRVKDTGFIATAQRAYRDLPPGVEEGLLRAEDGALLEGLSSNFFAVLDDRLHTEGDRALLGITRSLVLAVADPLIPLAGRAVRLDELRRIDEAFITSASREVLPVVRIDGEPVGDGGVGPVTRAIMQGLAALIQREAEVFG